RKVECQDRRCPHLGKKFRFYLDTDLASHLVLRNSPGRIPPATPPAPKTNPTPNAEQDGQGKKMGRPWKPEATEKMLFCFQEREKGESLSSILKLGYGIFGERAPQTEADVSKYASRWEEMSEKEKAARLEQLKEWKNTRKNGG